MSVLILSFHKSSEIDKLKTAGIVSQTSHLFQYGVFCPLEEELWNAEFKALVIILSFTEFCLKYSSIFL
jgi:hypothetical protein